MTRATTHLAVAADYADALMTARRAKNWLFILILLMLVMQVAVFLMARYDVIRLTPTAAPTAASVDATTEPAPAPAPAKSRIDPAEVARYAIPITNFVAVGLSVVLTVVTLLLLAIMLLGRLIGVSYLTSSFIWAVLAIVVLFPWQTVLVMEERYPLEPAPRMTQVEQPAFRWPGALYTYAELMQDHKAAVNPIFPNAVWLWGRHVGLPVLAALLLLLVQTKSGRGLRFALGESDVHVEVAPRSDTGTMIG